jgi:2-phospho-L-lactate transferase/gluconeogenesis factor (CofD/UPF0052 family)
MVNVVSFNGGRGAKNLIPALANIDGINLTSIVNAYDDGKSTGTIRAFFRMLGPSDIRKVQEAMVPQELTDYNAIMRAYDYRYPASETRETIMSGLNAFGTGSTDELCGIQFQDKTIQESLRVFIQCLLRGIRLIERAEAKVFSFHDCSLMNLIYAGAYLHFGHNFEDATIFIDKLFKLKGTVLPTSNEDRKLVAIREDGTILYSEAEIVELRANSRIKRIYLLDQYPDKQLLSEMSMEEVEEYFDMAHRLVGTTARVVQSISDADIIIYSPGTQHSSLYPSYMTLGITDAIAANKKALKVFITNIGEDYETPSYDANDFIEGAIRYMRMGSEYDIAVKDLIDFALVNNKFSTNLENYVKYDEAQLDTIGCPVIIDAFEDTSSPGKHNGGLLSKFIMDLYQQRMNIGTRKAALV